MLLQSPLGTPAPAGSIPQGEIDEVKSHWQINPGDLGMGIYNIDTGEMHVSTMGEVGGHPTLAGKHAQVDSPQFS